MNLLKKNINNKKIVENHPYKIICAKQITTSNEKKTKEFYKEALKNNQEGIMMKNIKSPYKPGRRVWQYDKK